MERVTSIKMHIMLFGLLITVGSSAFATHPNPGDVILSSLVSEALKSNLEIREAERQASASQASRKQAISPYLPEVSLEGGYQSSRFDNETSDGSFGYGKANLNLYRGGKDQATYQSRVLDENFQKLRLQKTKARIERSVSKLYYELLYLQEGMAVKEEALTANKTQMALAEKKKSAGFTSKADVLEFELREATLRSDLNFLKQEESTKERELRQLLGRTEGPIIRVGGHLRRESFRKSVDDLLKLAIQERGDLKEAEKNIAAANIEYKSLFGDYMPRVDLEGKYGRLNGEERVFKNDDNYSMMMKVSIPLFSGLETVYGRQSKSQEIAKSELAAGRIKQEIQVQLSNAISRLKSVEERLDLEEKNIERSKQYYDLTLSEYRKGVKNSPDVAGAAERLFDARLRNLEYRKDFYLTCVEIAAAVDVASGEILEKQ